jgi:hypothetical protein
MSFFTPWHNLWIANDHESIDVAARKRMESLAEVRVCVGNLFVEPELNTWQARFGRFQEISQHA